MIFTNSEDAAKALIELGCPKITREWLQDFIDSYPWDNTVPEEIIELGEEVHQSVKDIYDEGGYKVEQLLEAHTIPEMLEVVGIPEYQRDDARVGYKCVVAYLEALYLLTRGDDGTLVGEEWAELRKELKGARNEQRHY